MLLRSLCSSPFSIRVIKTRTDREVENAAHIGDIRSVFKCMIGKRGKYKRIFEYIIKDNHKNYRIGCG
jgi:hypothetical protein